MPEIGRDTVGCWWFLVNVMVNCLSDFETCSTFGLASIGFTTNPRISRVHPLVTMTRESKAMLAAL